MTFDDGILTIYEVTNSAQPGAKPVPALAEKSRHYFEYETLGVTRYYTALQANQQIAAVVDIPGWNDVKTTDICVLEDGGQYTVAMVQPTFDEDGLRITKLSLERVSQTYEVPEQS